MAISSERIPLIGCYVIIGIAIVTWGLVMFATPETKSESCPCTEITTQLNKMIEQEVTSTDALVRMENLAAIASLCTNSSTSCSEDETFQANTVVSKFQKLKSISNYDLHLN